MTSRSTAPGGSPASSWCSAECSESTGISWAPVASASARHELAADDERLLVGERDVDALGERDDRRAEAGRADDRVEHEVGVGLGDEPHEPLGAGQHLALGPRLGGARGGVGVGERDPAHAVLARLLDQRARGERSADSPTSSNSSAARATTSSAWVPIEPVEPRISSRFILRAMMAGALAAISADRRKPGAPHGAIRAWRARRRRRSVEPRARGGDRAASRRARGAPPAGAACAPRARAIGRRQRPGRRCCRRVRRPPVAGDEAAFGALAVRDRGEPGAARAAARQRRCRPSAAGARPEPGGARRA